MRFQLLGPSSMRPGPDHDHIEEIGGPEAVAADSGWRGVPAKGRPGRQGPAPVPGFA